MTITGKKELKQVRDYLKKEGCSNVKFYDNGQAVSYIHPGGFKVHKTSIEILRIMDARQGNND